MSITAQEVVLDELERLRKANAAMREALTALNGQRNVMANSLNWFGSAKDHPENAENVRAAAKQFWDADSEFGRILQSALQPDSGARYLSPDSKRLDWMQSIMTLREDYVEIYLAGLRNGDSEATGFQFEANPHFPKWSLTNGKTLRDAIDEAMNSHAKALGL